jgi:hypothetical protein
MAKVGRPTSYKPEYCEQVQKLCALAATDIEIADFFAISVKTLNFWKIKYPEFGASIIDAKEIADIRVQRSLYQRAVGYTFESEKVFQYQGEIVRAKTLEHVPPDTTAAQWWLRNRQPSKWRDLHQYEIGGPGDFAALSDDALADALVAKMAALGLVDVDAETKH